MNKSFKEKLKKSVAGAPQTPGVYFFRKNKKVLYVGRATNLRQRLRQYFQKNVDSRIAEMVNSADNLKWLSFETLLEAIVVEAKYIKKYWPKYNIKDKDGRSFIYIIIPKKTYTYPLIVRGKDLSKWPPSQAFVFGPYQSLSLVQNALRLLRRIFPYGTCRAQGGQACFDYQIGLCPGSCLGIISKVEYQKNIRGLILILKGERKKLLKQLINANPAKAKALRHLQEVTLLAREEDINQEKISRLEAYDISHLSGKESYGSMVVLENGLPAKKEYRLFKIKSAPPGDDERALAEVLSRRFEHLEWSRPDIVLIDGGKPQVDFISRYLQKNNISIPLLGISKLAGDKLVYPIRSSRSFMLSMENLKPTLLLAREEAHRFGLRAHRRQRGKGIGGIKKSLV